MPPFVLHAKFEFTLAHPFFRVDKKNYSRYQKNTDIAT